VAEAGTSSAGSGQQDPDLRALPLGVSREAPFGGRSRWHVEAASEATSARWAVAGSVCGKRGGSGCGERKR
jgi:hypothetical protein